MATRIEDFALIGNCRTAALINRDASIEWLCLPRFDSDACFAALLGSAEHGRWLLQPAERVSATRRAYRGASLVLETEFETADGCVAIVDFMPPHTPEPEVVRIVVGKRGRVRMQMELLLRFGFGSIVPWVRGVQNGITAVGGPDAVRVTSGVPLRGEDLRTIAEFTVASGESVPFSMIWHPSDRPAPTSTAADELLSRTEAWWARWAKRCTYKGPWEDAVMRSLITLKALTFAPTAGICAAPTTSLPERIGGVRNWDYRLCWLRDATFTLYALMVGGYTDEACAWRNWLVRAVAGTPSQVQPVYGLAGERRLTETELPWLPGYEGSRPVRIGNVAHQQLQLDVFGELMDAFDFAHRAGLQRDENAWRIERALLAHLEEIWHRPDAGIWEMRGAVRHFTHSKVMVWVAFDRGIRAVEEFGLDGPADRWRAQRDAVHREVCDKGFDRRLNSFVQYYGAEHVDAALLMLPLVGFLPPEDDRIRGTLAAIETQLIDPEGFVSRYPSHTGVDGLPGGEGRFLLCTFWLADNYALLGRRDDAVRLFRKLLSVANDVGLLSEEYDPGERRFLGNFPQAFSHVALINSARNLAGGGGPGDDRRRRGKLTSTRYGASGATTLEFSNEPNRQ